MSENIPVDVIVSFNTLGEIKPVWIRLENNEHELKTYELQVNMTSKTNYAGFHYVNFICSVIQEGLLSSILLKYSQDTGKWYLEG